MIFGDPEKRRALRSIVQAVVAFVLLGFLWFWAERLQSAALLEVTRWALAIIGLGTLGYAMENGLRALKLSVGKGGLNVQAGGDTIHDGDNVTLEKNP